MPLRFVHANARHTGALVTWTNITVEDGQRVETPQNLTGAILSGRIKPYDTAGRDTDGSLAPQTPLTAGVFLWTYGVQDVTGGVTGNTLVEVQFTATYPADSNKTDKSDREIMLIKETI